MYGKSVFRVKGVTMIRYLYRVLILAMLTGVVLVSPHAQAAGARKDSSQPLKAFLFKDIPVDQDAREKLFLSLKGRGANAVIIDTAGQSHLTEEDVLPNLVFLVHKARLKLFLMVPVRNLPSVVSEHRKWEDLRYDLTSGTTQPTGKLSLFHPDAVNYLAESIKKIASDSASNNWRYRSSLCRASARASLRPRRTRFSTAVVSKRVSAMSAQPTIGGI